MMQPNFGSMLKETIGLDSSSIGSSAVESAVRSCMASLGLVSEQEYWDVIHQSSEEFQQLVETVIVPETWFFRDREAFSALSRLIVTEWLPYHPGAVLRMLSGACCSGEEPYSMAMALLDAGLSRKQLHIDAVDISDRGLERARKKIYGAHSFRGTDLSYRDRYFERTSHGYLLADWFSEIVTFIHGNLLEVDLHLELASYQVVFCRNLLIYFDHNTQEQVLKKLGLMLEPTGLLFVGSAEAFLTACSGFKSVNASMAFAFRKDNAPSSIRTYEAPLVLPVRAMFKPRVLNAVKTPAAPVPFPPPPLCQPIDLESVRRLADAGRLAEARERCEAYLREESSSAEALYLMGVVNDAFGDHSQAAECYRKVLYLQPNHEEALMQLALLTEREGDSATATRLRGRARRAVSHTI